MNTQYNLVDLSIIFYLCLKIYNEMFHLSLVIKKKFPIVGSNFLISYLNVIKIRYNLEDFFITFLLSSNFRSKIFNLSQVFKKNYKNYPNFSYNFLILYPKIMDTQYNLIYFFITFHLSPNFDSKIFYLKKIFKKNYKDYLIFGCNFHISYPKAINPTHENYPETFKKSLAPN